LARGLCRDEVFREHEKHVAFITNPEEPVPLDGSLYEDNLGIGRNANHTALVDARQDGHAAVLQRERVFHWIAKRCREDRVGCKTFYGRDCYRNLFIRRA
jgi:hypothetical protein